MALHIQMTEEAEAELRKAATRNKLSSTAAGILFLVLGGLILFFTVILIAGPSDPEFLTYTPPAEDAPPTPQPTTQDLTSKPASSSHDVAPSVIVAVGAAPVQMAQVEIPVDDSSDGTGLELGVGLGTGGLGTGLGSGGNGLGDGKGGGSALEGTFYDFKQTRQGSPTGISGPAQMKCMEIIYDFMKNNWNPGALSKYYQSPTKLYISNFYAPQVKSEYAPEAFNCSDKVQPADWCAIYRGKVKAPKSGTFRFMSVCDETMLVRFNNQLVLESGYRIPSGFPEGKIQGNDSAEGKLYKQAIRDGKQKNHPGYEYFEYKELPTYNREVGGLTCGTPFKVEEGKSYPIEILISDTGGAFGFFLCIQDITNGKEKPAKPDLFRTNFSAPNKEVIKQTIPAQYIKESSGEYLEYNEDSPIWVAVP